MLGVFLFMKIYDIAKGTLYDSIILSLLKRNIISLDEAVNCLNDIDIQLNRPNDLNNNLFKLKQKGLTNTSTGKSESEVIDYE
jgi:hypothetical protein